MFDSFSSPVPFLFFSKFEQNIAFPERLFGVILCMLLERFKIKCLSEPFDRLVQIFFHTPSFSVALSNNLCSLRIFDYSLTPIVLLPLLFFSKFEKNTNASLESFCACCLRDSKSSAFPFERLFGSVLCVLLERFKVKCLSEPFDRLVQIFFHTPSFSVARMPLWLRFVHVA
eukprot:TRINITY_DN1080_c0_g1_i6.p1 TRINITY_DN1080_c0_g1~~TRINITY_DN1080_c0_g1_i6.p1  ORF type:complete len:172 (+),score=29.12 TRINITY_DN1080_c0_g1_i6:168-683(+)